MRYEYDRAVEAAEGRPRRAEQYRGLVERVTRQAQANRAHVQKLEAETKAYLKAGDRATPRSSPRAARRPKRSSPPNEAQLQLHETAYGNSLKKIQHANEKLIEPAREIQKYDAELKMSSPKPKSPSSRKPSTST